MALACQGDAKIHGMFSQVSRPQNVSLRRSLVEWLKLWHRKRGKSNRSMSMRMSQGGENTLELDSGDDYITLYIYKKKKLLNCKL